jgi:hypothetical protein
MLAFRNSPLGQGLCLVFAFLLEEEALGLAAAWSKSAKSSPEV